MRTTFIGILKAMDKSGSFAEPVSKLSSEDARISTTLAAIVSLVSLAVDKENTAARFHLGSNGHPRFAGMACLNHWIPRRLVPDAALPPASMQAGLRRNDGGAYSCRVCASGFLRHCSGTLGA